MMKRNVVASVLLAWMFVVLGAFTAELVIPPAQAAASPSPQGTYGLVTLAATTATRIPAAASILDGRTNIIVVNLSATRIWCGWDSSVTDTNGTPVEPSGGSFNFPISYQPSLSTQALNAQLWCYATVVQGASTNTRWMQVR